MNISFIADTGNKFFVSACHWYVFMTITTFNLLLFCIWSSEWVVYACYYMFWIDLFMLELEPNLFIFYWRNNVLKVVSATFLLVCFLSKREHSWNKEKCFLFHLESSFRSWDNQILNFQIFKCYDVIKCSSMKHETHFTE